MSFLHPWALALGLLAAVPVLLHLRRREATRRVAFPALRYLRRAREARARSLRTRDLLLLAVRVAVILSLVLAAAGPLVGRGDAADHHPTDVAIVLDNSASTGRLVGEERSFDHLVATVRAVLAAAGPGDRFWVLPAVGAPLAAAVSAERAREALARARVTGGGADLRQAVAGAGASLPPGPERAREVHLMSDLQASGFPGGPGETVDVGDGGPAPRDARLVVYRARVATGANAGIVSLVPSEGVASPVGRPQTVAVEVRRYPGPGGREEAGEAAVSDDAAVSGDATATRVRLEVDGSTVGIVRAPRDAPATFRLSDLEPGIHVGRAEIEPDAFRADDVRHFVLRVFRAPSVRLRGPEESFIAVGLETLRAAGRIGDEVPPIVIVEGTAGGRAAAGEVSFASPPDGTGVRAGAGQGDAGGAVRTRIFVPPGDAVDLPAFNQLLAGAGVPWRLEPDPSRGGLELAGTGGVPGLERTRIRIRHLLVGESGRAAGDTVLLHTSDGRPWLVRGRGDGGAHLLLASPLTPEATTLPADAAMVPFLEALLLRWSARGGWPDRDVPAGVPFPLPPWADSVRSLSGEVAGVEGGAPFTPLEAGIHDVYGPAPGGAGASGQGPSGPSARFAAHVPAAESDPERIDPARLEELFVRRDVVIAGPDEGEWRNAIFGSRRGAAATPWFVLLALALAAVEVMAATPGRSKDSPRRTQTTFTGT